jgi:hypothetical protein
MNADGYRKLFPPLATIFGFLFTVASQAFAEPGVQEETLGPAQGVAYVISPKGVRVAMVATKGSRMAVTVDGIEGPVFDQILSPDGNPYGQPTTQAMVITGNRAPVVFSDDGKRYAYAARQGNEYVIVLDGREFARGPIGVKVFGYGPLAFANGNGHLWWIAKAGSDPHYLFVNGRASPPSHGNITVVFSPDGTRYAATGTNPPNVGGGKWYAVDGRAVADPGTNPQFTGDNRLVAIDVSRPGEAVLTVEGKPLVRGRSVDQVWTSPVGGTVAAIVADAAGKRSFTVDGKLIPGTSEGNVQILNLFFSPDGKRWAAHGTDQTMAHFMIVDGKRGLNYQHIESSVNPPAWTPDSSKFIFAASNAGRLFAVVDEEESDGFRAFLGSSRMRYAMARTGGRYGYMTSENTTPRSFQYVIDGKRQTLKDMMAAGDTLAFSENGTSYAFVAGPAARNEFTTLVHNGEPVSGMRVDTFNPFGAIEPTTNYYTLSPDGHYFATGGTAESDKKTGLFINGRLVREQRSARISPPLFTPDSRHIFWLESERIQPTGTEYVLYVDGEPTGIRISPMDVMNKTREAWEMGADGTLMLLAFSGDALKRYRVSPARETGVAKLVEGAASRTTVTVRTPAAAAAAPSGVTAASFDGNWYSNQHKYGFRIQGNSGVATHSSSRRYGPGDEILRIESVSGGTFQADHMFSNGRWNKVTAQLVNDSTLRITGGGFTWDMVRTE